MMYMMMTEQEHAQVVDALEATVNVPCYGGHPRQEAALAMLKAMQPVEPVIGTKTWMEDGKVVTQNLHPSDVYKNSPNLDTSAERVEKDAKTIQMLLEALDKCVEVSARCFSHATWEAMDGIARAAMLEVAEKGATP